jgi:hypothetical protein
LGSLDCPSATVSLICMDTICFCPLTSPTQETDSWRQLWDSPQASQSLHTILGVGNTGEEEAGVVTG